MKKILIAVIGVAIIGLGYWAMVKKPGQFAQPKPGSQSVQKPADVNSPTFTYTEPGEAPEGFPSAVPIEKNAKITDNFSAVTPEGKKIAVREFVSKKTVAQNYELYKKFLKDNGYVQENDLIEQSQSIISGIKDSYRLRVRIYEAVQEVRVTLNYVQL